MKKDFFAIFIFFCLSSIAYGQPQSANTNNYSTNNTQLASSTCMPYRNPQLYGYAEVICEGKILAALTEFVNQTFKLPQKLLIVGGECGTSNAFYLPGKAQIQMCYELVKDISDRVQREIKADGKVQQQIAMGAFVFIFLHELGHALVDILRLPVLGRQEDAADQIGTYLLIAITEQAPHISNYWPAGAHWFFRKTNLFYSQKHYAGQHSLDPQRQFNIACWLFGSHPKKYFAFAKNAGLPQSRAQNCSREFRDMQHAANEMLYPYLSESFKQAKHRTNMIEPNTKDPRRETASNSCNPTTRSNIPSIIGLDYHNARFSLLSQGWQPIQPLQNPALSSAQNSRIGNSMAFLSQGYRELESCSGTGTAPCAFMFSDSYGTRLRIITEGEEIPENKMFATVSKYNFICDHQSR